MDESQRDEPDSFWILLPEQLACLASSKRQAVLDLIATSGPVSANGLADLSGSRRTTLYQHLDKLLSVGLVEPAGQLGTGPKAEQLYRTPARRMRLARALTNNDNAAIAARIAGALLRQTQRDVESGLTSDRKQVLGPSTNLLFHRYLGSPSAARLTEINQKIEELKALIMSADAGNGEPVALTLAMAPVDGI